MDCTEAQPRASACGRREGHNVIISPRMERGLLPMKNYEFAEKEILESWRRNASPWTAAVRTGQIESRRICTDEAIVAAVLSRSPASVIDLGCGEGWLVRALALNGVEALGVDAIPELIGRARTAGGGSFRVMAYEEISVGQLESSADVVVCNFSLFGHRSVERIFRAVPALLNPAGAFIVQTLHPVATCGPHPYRDGWREGSWAGFGPEFTAPAPWYFRTLEGWVRLFADSGFRLLELREPVLPESGNPASVVFIAVAAIG